MKRVSAIIGLGILVAAACLSASAQDLVITIVKAPAPCTPPPSGLVAWWPAEGNGSDIVSGNNGTVNGALGYTNGEVGQAFVFDDSTSYLSIPASSSLDVGATGTGLTIECWIQPDSFDTGVSGAPIMEWDSPSTDGVQFWSGGALYANIIDTTGAYHRIESTLGLPVSNVWQHVALTYDKASGNAVIYWNGTVVATNNLGSFTPQTTYPVNIGRRTGQPIGLNDTYGGLMDELSLYNRALSSNEIAAIFDAGSAGKCSGNFPPLIVTPPASQTVIEGGEVDLSVVAAGAGTLSYQWLFNGKNISGASSVAYSVPDIHPNQAGNYAVKVTSAGGSVTSSPAIITVIQQNILIYNYSGNEKITTLGKETSYGFSGQLFFIPDTTNAVFVGWANISGKKQYWVTPMADYLWFKVAGAFGRTYTILGKASSGFDNYGRPTLWSFLHKGQNTTLLIGTKKTFSFPNTFAFSDTQIYPDPQTGNMLLREASSNYSFQANTTQTANNTGQTVDDLVAALVKLLVKQGYQPQ